MSGAKSDLWRCFTALCLQRRPDNIFQTHALSFTLALGSTVSSLLFPCSHRKPGLNTGKVSRLVQSFLFWMRLYFHCNLVISTGVAISNRELEVCSLILWRLNCTCAECGRMTLIKTWGAVSARNVHIFFETCILPFKFFRENDWKNMLIQKEKYGFRSNLVCQSTNVAVVFP